MARTLGLVVTGVDVDADQIRAAQQAARRVERVSFRQADAAHLPFPDQSFLVVATNKTTHHIPEWRGALAEMTRVLAPGGYLVYADLTIPTWMAALLRPIGRPSGGLFTRDDLDDWFLRLDLDLVVARTSWCTYEAVFHRSVAHAD